MENFEGIFDLTGMTAGTSGKDKEVTELYKGERRRILFISLRNGAVLTKHKAAEPITVQCISGGGKFSAGADLSDTVNMTPGMLVTLPANVEHEAVAEPELHILVSRFID